MNEDEENCQQQRSQQLDVEFGKGQGEPVEGRQDPRLTPQPQHPTPGTTGLLNLDVS
jgi:hypothetical protein